MKKIIAAATIAAAVTGLAGCGSEAEKKEVADITRAQTRATIQTQQAEEISEFSADELKPLYKAPADFVKIDPTLDDPTTGEMKFLYDGKKRVVCESYTIEGHPVRVDYGYDDSLSKVKIIAYMENRIVDEKTIDLPDFDDAVGFADKEGYYFRGYKFE